MVSTLLNISSPVHRLWTPLVIVLLGVGYYLPRILASPGFTGDDFYLLTVASDPSLSWLGSFSADVPYFFPFRPLTMLSFHVNHLLAGTDAQSYLFVNLALLLGTSVLLYLIILHLQQDLLARRNARLAFILSLIFLVHAGMFHHVLWTSQRTETLMLFFYAAALLTALRYFRYPSPWMMAAVILLYVLSLLSKSTGLHFPLIFFVLAVLYARSEHGPMPWKRRLCGSGGDTGDVSRSFRGWMPQAGLVRSVLLRSLPLLLVMAGYGLARLLLDPSAGGFPLAWLIKKPFTFVGVTMASIHPDLAVLLYKYAGYDVLPAALVTGVFFLSLATMFYAAPRYRGWYSVALLVYAITFLPRILARADARVNSLQILVLLIIAGMFLLQRSKTLPVMGLSLFLLAHLGAGYSAMRDHHNAVSAETRLIMPYAHALNAGELDGITAVFSHINVQQVLPYQMHFLRYGNFGVDSSVRGSGIGFAPKPFSRTSAPRVKITDGDAALVHIWTWDRRMEFFSIDAPFPSSAVTSVEADPRMVKAVNNITLRVTSPRDRWAYLVILPDTVIVIE